MALTDVQIQTLANDMSTNTDQTVIDALAAGDLVTLDTWYNQQASPDFYVWRNSMPIQEMKDQHFDWSEVVGLGTSALLALQVLTSQEQVDPSRQTIRDAFGDVFSGPSGVNTRTALATAAKHLANNAQKALASGTGSSAEPATTSIEAVSLDDIRAVIKAINEG